MTKPLRILIVEDEELIAMLLAETVEALGHEVCATAATQAAAVAAAEALRPDLMIVDSGLGDSSGVDAVATILKTSFIPHLFVTGNALEVAARRPDAVILQKPFFVPELVTAIARARAMQARP
ncbi:MAG: response regulator [Sphingomonas sp. 28-66-16]|nr:MAG: response regulator [Sphingomonas sp. 28-66-16]